MPGIPLDEVSTSMTINAPAALLLLCYELVAAEHGVPANAVRGTVQNDVLKEYVARGNYSPAAPVDAPDDRPVRVLRGADPEVEHDLTSGYHSERPARPQPRSSPSPSRTGSPTARPPSRRASRPTSSAARLSFFNAHNHVLQEVAKFRAASRLRATITRDRFGATSPKAQALRFHAQTGGSTLTAQQPETDSLVRVAAQALSAVYGGAQSIHTNAVRQGAALPSRACGDAGDCQRSRSSCTRPAPPTRPTPSAAPWLVESLTDDR